MWPTEIKFNDVTVMEEELRKEFSDFIGSDIFHYGFIQPGHGFRGKQQTILEDNDLVLMYDKYKNKNKSLSGRK